MPRRAHPPIHPGEILAQEFLAPLALNAQRIARDTKVPVRRVRDLIRGKHAITAEIAMRFARYFGTSEEFWMRLQVHYDLGAARDRLGARLRREVAVMKRKN